MTDSKPANSVKILMVSFLFTSWFLTGYEFLLAGLLAIFTGEFIYGYYYQGFNEEAHA
ncbi:MAG: hypothetical protein ABEI52_10465 [Halobacteriaceae archaeon]